MSTQNLKPQQPLTDDEASKEMKKMVAFIMQEAAEKTRELHIRADEEFNIEKAKIVHQETVAIEQQFGRKLKQAEVKRRIAQSVQMNKARLRVLQARDTVLDEILEEARRQLRETSGSAPQYEELMRGLILQCLYRLMDPKVVLTCREADRPVAEKALGRALEDFRRETGTTCQVSLDGQKHLPANCAGGVVASSLEGRIRCDNTLEARLEQSFEKMLPTLRVRLFGPSPNRKFFD